MATTTKFFFETGVRVQGKYWFYHSGLRRFLTGLHRRDFPTAQGSSIQAFYMDFKFESKNDTNKWMQLSHLIGTKIYAPAGFPSGAYRVGAHLGGNVSHLPQAHMTTNNVGQFFGYDINFDNQATGVLDLTSPGYPFLWYYFESSQNWADVQSIILENFTQAPTRTPAAKTNTDHIMLYGGYTAPLRAVVTPISWNLKFTEPVSARGIGCANSYNRGIPYNWRIDDDARFYSWRKGVSGYRNNIMGALKPDDMGAAVWLGVKWK